MVRILVLLSIKRWQLNKGFFCRTPLLLANESIIFTSPITLRTSSPALQLHLPAFLLPAPKKRQLVLTDFPRLLMIKDDTEADAGDPAGSGSGAGSSSLPQGGNSGGGTGESSVAAAAAAGGGGGGGHGSLRIKGEAVFVPRPATATGTPTAKGSGYSTVPNAVMDVQEKGTKGFTVQTVSRASLLLCFIHQDTDEMFSLEWFTTAMWIVES